MLPAAMLLSRLEGFWWSKAMGPAPSSPPRCGSAGLLQQRGLEKGTSWCCSDCAFSSQGREDLISPSCTRRAAGWAWARDSWGSTSAASARGAGALGSRTHARFLLCDLPLSLSSLSSSKLLLFLAFKAFLWKCLALEDMCATVSYRCLLGYIWAVKEVFCRDKVLASCQSKAGTWPGLCNTACGVWFPSIKPHIWHREQCVLARRWNITRWKSSPVSHISGMLVGSQQAVWYEVPKESAKWCSQRATTN